MHDLAAIDAVLQHVVKGAPSKRLASICAAVGRHAVLADNAGHAYNRSSLAHNNNRPPAELAPLQAKK